MAQLLLFFLPLLALSTAVQVTYVNHRYEVNEALTNGFLAPIRFHVESSGDDMLGGLNRALDMWSEFLSTPTVLGPLKLDIAQCGDVTVPESHRLEGVADTDFILYVADSRKCPNKYRVETCAYDQFDRPIAGTFCADQDHAELSLQAVGRLLGHSSTSFPHFWDASSGFPRNERPLSAPPMSCQRHGVVHGDSNVLEWQEDANGKPYLLLVTPSVRTVVQNHFHCASLPGARLANKNLSSCSYDLLSPIHFPDDIMAQAGGNYITPLTLALFEDSGWYQANWNSSQISPWGLGAGCDFVDEPCSIADSGGDSSPPEIPTHARGYFCSATTSEAAAGSFNGCSPGLTHKGQCSSIVQHTDADKEEEADQPNCPIVPPKSAGGTTTSSIDCRHDNGDVGFLNPYREVFGEDSRCIESPSNGGGAYCYRLSCDQEDRQVKVNVGGEWLSCELDFQQLDTSVLSGGFQVICPRFAQACPHLFSCPFHCRGRGTCIREDGGRAPSCQCFNPSDLSDSCSISPSVSSPSVPAFFPTGSPSFHPSLLVWPRSSLPQEKSPMQPSFGSDQEGFKEGDNDGKQHNSTGWASLQGIMISLSVVLASCFLAG